jgi:hypothetical protein
MAELAGAPIAPGVIFDAEGNLFSAAPGEVERWVGIQAAGSDIVGYAVRTLGFVQIMSIRDALVIEFAPGVTSPLAVISAFYEVAERAPQRIALVARGDPDRFELYRDPAEARRRIEELLTRRSAPAR